MSLVEPPDLSYQLILQGGDITFLPGLEVFINSLLKDVLLCPYVWPDGFTVPLVPGGGREVRPPSARQFSTLYVFCFQGSIKGLIERFRLELQVPLPTLQDIFEGSPRLLRAV